MIGKLNYGWQAGGGYVEPTSDVICDKINELCDAINALVYEHDKDSDWYDGQTRVENVQPDAESRPENVQDKFAEQRKWIGKLCRFWDANPDKRQLDILIDIDSGITPYEIDTSYYQNCEPVKPDDSIIYKGGDNE